MSMATIEANEIIERWNAHAEPDQELLFVRKLRNILPQEKVAEVLEAVEGTCKRCWNAPGDCFCCSSV